MPWGDFWNWRRRNCQPIASHVAQVHVKGLSPSLRVHDLKAVHTVFFPFNPIAIDQHVLHISTSYASPEFTVGICCLLLHLQVVSPISYLLGSECSSFLHRSGASPDDSLRPSARYDQFDHRFTFWINAGTTAPWALDFLDVCCCLVVFFLRT